MSDSITAVATSEALPHWDVSAIFPGLETVEFEEGFDAAIEKIKSLEFLFDREDVRQEVTSVAHDATLVPRFESIINEYNSVVEQISTLRAYISAFVTTDSRNAVAQSKMSVLRIKTISLGNLGTRLTGWLGKLDIDWLVEHSSVAKAHAYFLSKTAIRAKHLLSTPEEELAADLNLSGGSAWAKLHGDITSQLTVPLGDNEYPISVIRSFASSVDAEQRRLAYEAEIKAWKTVALPLCAAMNGIKHESNVMAERRGWNDPLEIALFGNNIDKEILDAMMTAAKAAFPDFRRYLKAKAKYLSGSEQLPWYDLFAPIGKSEKTWEWPEAVAFIEKQFGTYSDKMRDFALRAFNENWIDAEPRPGKRDGAFCMGIRPGESRILQNYKPAFDGVSTLAHELGHGYHNLCLGERTPMQRQTPMTLAETASIFCETAIRQAVFAEGDPVETLPVLEDAIQGNCQVVVDITSRFLFEQNVFEQRKSRELSVDDMCELMLQAQRDTYGDGLDPNTLHPYMWAVKGHYYGSAFYNYPYMFGLLFGLGLYAQFQTDPASFRVRYDDLLSRTGMASASDLALEFGIDIRSVDFWTSSLDVIRRDIDLFEKLTSGPQ